MTPIEAAVVLLAAGGALLAFLSIARWVGNSWYANVGAVALMGHVGFGTLVLPRLPYSWDIGQFHREALTILAGRLPSDSTTVDSFAGPQSVLYASSVSDPVIVSVFNGLCAVLVALPAADLARQLYPGLKTTRGIVVSILFLPLPFVLLTIPMRDSLGVLIFVGLLAALARTYNGQRWPAVLALPLWGALSMLRPELAAIVLIGAVAGAAVRILDAICFESLSLRSLIGLATLPGVIVLFALIPRIPVQSFVRRLQNRAVGGGAYLETMTYETGTDVILSAPIRAIYFQYAPFPIHVTSLFDFIAVTMLPVLAALTVAAYRSARECDRDIAVLVLLLTTYLLGIVGYGLIDSNFGTTVRHRIPFTFILCILAAPALERWTNLLLGPVGIDTAVDSTTGSERVSD